MTQKNNQAKINDSSQSNGGSAGNALTRDISIPQLRAVLKGQVITPQDAGYDQARSLFYGGFDRHPAVIVPVADAEDVAKVVSLARESGLPLAVRSGGHSLAGHSVPDGGICSI